MEQTRARFVVVVHLLVLRHERVLLIRRARGSRSAGAWAPPGGHLEAGEMPSAAAARECLEETGVAVLAADLKQVATLAYRDGRDTGFNLLFTAQLAAPVPLRPDPLAASAVALVPLAQLPAPRVPWLDQALMRLSQLPSGGAEVPWYGEASGPGMQPPQGDD